MRNRDLKAIRSLFLLTVVLTSVKLFAKPVDHDWLIADSDSYTLVTDGDPARSQSTLNSLQVLEQLFLSELSTQIAFEETNPLKHLIFLARKRKFAAELSPLTENGRAINADGVFLLSQYYPIILSTAQRDERLASVHHEYIHRLIEAHIGKLPPWAEEGVAELFTSIERGNKIIHFGLIRQNDPVFRLRGGNLQSWDLFFNTINQDLLHSISYQTDQAPNYYAQAKLLVHFIVFSNDGKLIDPFFEMAKVAVKGSINEFDTRRFLGFSYSELDRTIKAHLKEIRDNFKSYDAEAFEPHETSIFKRLPPNELQIYKARILTIGRRFAEANILLNSVKDQSDTSGLWNSVKSELVLLQTRDIAEAASYSYKASELGQAAAFDLTLSVQHSLSNGDGADNSKFLIDQLTKAFQMGDRSVHLFELYHEITERDKKELDTFDAEFLWEGLKLHPRISYSSKIFEISELLN